MSGLRTPADLAEEFGKSERWVLEQVREHGWPRVKIGRTIRFTEEQVSLILSRHTITAKAVDVAPALDGQTKRSARRAS
jgi:hypothetical protein